MAAILAADVAGYSRLMGADEVGTLAALKALRREIVDPAIGDHKGRIVKTTGDGMLVEFASVVDAVSCAMAVQAQLAEHGGAIRFRIGINIGDIIIDGGDIFGDGVNIAARVETECEPGGVCLSDDAFRQVRGKTSFSFDDLGEKSLKNIDRPVRLYAARRAETKPAANPVRSDPIEPLALPDKPSIAVLPFQNMSGDPEQEYFADGMVEDIITALSRFKSLFVIARNSSFTYKGKPIDIRQVGRELGVRYVLEGSIRRAGEKVRITTQLVDAASGSHLWADRFDGNLSDVFEMQDSVTARVVGSITPALSEVELEAVGRKPVENWNSYDYYLRGQKLYHEGNQQGRVTATREALDLYRKAVELDPNLGRAHARLAQSIQVIQDLHGHPISDKERIEALKSAEQAVQLSGDDAMALASLVFIFGFLGGDFKRAAELGDRALALNTNLSMAWNARGVMSIVLGDQVRALEEFAKAMRLNPLDKAAMPFSLFGMAAACVLLGRYEEGAGFARRVLVLQPNDIRGLFTLTANTYFSGHLKEAEATVAQIKQLYPHLRAPHLRQAYRTLKPSDTEVVERAIRFIGLPD